MPGTRKLTIACPQCGSTEVSYSCSPACCFNHVCADCYTTFEPVTHATGATLAEVKPPEPLPEAADPTVACAKCESTAVYMVGAEELVCAKCGAMLTLELTEVAPG